MSSQRSLLVEVATGLSQPFAAEDLVVAVWTKHPEAFGLRGHEHSYPDSNKVLSYLMGEKGLVRAGLVRRVRPRVYEVPRPKPVPRTMPLKPAHQHLLEHLLNDPSLTVEWARIADNPTPFYGLRSPDSVKEALDEVVVALGDADTILHTGRYVKVDDVTRLIGVHAELEKASWKRLRGSRA